ncbi:MAG: HAMP domain-containing histidine kinase [Beijerinckiaceae bacterium]|jgi:signal transduction histidine kinase|nr:HAMP domain-containing histidine kinase [Beijerinckiaceae bacterium]
MIEKERPVPPSSGTPIGRLRPGLSGRLMLLSVLFVLIAEVLIYVPSIANYRNTWLNDRLAQGRAAALVLERAPPDSLPRDLIDDLLKGMDATMIALRIEQSRRLLAVADMPPPVQLEIDLRQRHPVDEIMSAFDILLFGSMRTMRVVGPAPGGGDFVELIINERRLRMAMLAYSWSILQVSLVICGVVAALLYLVLNMQIVRPVKALAGAMARFRDQPENARTLLEPSQREDELGDLERSIADMQESLRQQLRQREHLANLGLAVAKINHDLRNMLASAQLMADRLATTADPNVQRFVPKMLETLDRAIAFCQATLAYGKAQEQTPKLGPVALLMLVNDVGEQLALSPESVPALEVDIPPGLRVSADPDHLHRVLTNLLRNARAALENLPAEQKRVIRISAEAGGGQVRLDIRDSGPGIPPRIRETLFQAFSGSGQRGSTGLGLTIAQELLRGMGGDMTLMETPAGEGAHFRLSLPETEAQVAQVPRNGGRA